eukprot:TRINITY_DN3901_c0_g1_i2.p1 TRINITY_DN3901_c0_g1~~TRINITY_DN3901_c0_g1_i2.p1  ORF type:complete len:500 (+),score=92.13 TRINITY_DN3901_c0_g1_i2:36-1502(+)
MESSTQQQKAPQSLSLSGSGGDGGSTVAPAPVPGSPHLYRHDSDTGIFAQNLPRHVMVDDPSLSWFRKPHTLTMMIVTLLVIIVGAFTMDSNNTEVNVKVGLTAAAGAFLVFSVLYLHDGPFLRPHPAVWRFVTGCGIIYLLGLTFLFFQTPAFARHFLTYFDTALGVPLPERSYAENCEFYTPDHPHSRFANILDALHDEFALAHTIGWWAKMLLLRDVYLCVFLSCMFEIWELTLQHQLPNFAECWWDHIILDILVCNNIGIIAGWFTCRYLLKVKEYNWSGLWATKKGKIISSFVPTDFDEFQWEMLSNWRRFVSVLLFCLAISLIELNAFYLKFVLWVPPPHPLNIGRLLLWLFMGLPAAREYYQFVVDPNCYRFGPQAWLCVCIFSMETLVSIKLGRGMFPMPFPDEVFYPWVVFLAVATVGLIAYFSLRATPATTADASSAAVSKRKKQRGNHGNSNTNNNNNNNQSTKQPPSGLRARKMAK